MASGDNLSNEELERIKLQLEINTPWWRKPPMISIFSILITAILTISSLFIAYRVGLSEEKSERLALERKILESEVLDFNKTKEVFEKNLPLLKDSFRKERNKNSELLFENTVQKIYAQEKKEERDELIWFMERMIKDSTTSKDSLLRNMAKFIIEEERNYADILSRSFKRSFNKLSNEGYDLPHGIESSFYIDPDNKQYLIISILMEHKRFPGTIWHERWADDLSNLTKSLTFNIEQILKDHRGYVTEIIVIGNADQSSFNNIYDGSLGPISETEFHFVYNNDTILEKMFLDKGSPLTNKELAFLRGYSIMQNLLESNEINQGQVKLFASLNRVGGSRNVEIKIKLKEKYSEFFSKYYWNEERLIKIIEKYYE